MPAGTRSGTRPGTPDRAVPIVGVPGLPRCRPSSTVERRVNASGRGNCYRRLFLVTGKSWRRPPCLRRLRGIVKPRLQWLKVSEWEWERGKREWGGKIRENISFLRVFVATTPGRRSEKMTMLCTRRWMTFMPVVNTTTTTTRVVQNVQVVFIDFTNPCLARHSAALPNLETEIICKNTFWQPHQWFFRFFNFWNLSMSWNPTSCYPERQAEQY